MAVDMSEEAAKPAKAADDAGMIEAVPIPDKIAAEKFQASRTAKSGSSSVWAGCRMNKAAMPGAIGKNVTGSN